MHGDDSMSAAPHLRLVQTAVDENGEVVPGCPHCASARSEAEVWEERVLELERKVKRLTEDRDAKVRNDKHFPAALGLFEEWQQECGHPNARFDFARIRLSLSAVKLYGKDREKLSWVIQHGKHLAYIDERGVRHDSFGLLFRDAEHIERYANGFARALKRNPALYGGTDKGEEAA
jgi:hypothetical protein